MGVPGSVTARSSALAERQATAETPQNLATTTTGDPVLPSDSIYRHWYRIAESMLALPDSYEWIAISCRRYGVSWTAEENPISLVVSVRKDSPNNVWTTPMRRVQVLLSEFNVRDVDIIFQKNGIVPYVENPTLDSAACTKAVKPGVSIGINSSTAGSSTLGGLVRLRFGREWKTYGITAFHCVWAPPDHRQTLAYAASLVRRVAADIRVYSDPDSHPAGHRGRADTPTSVGERPVGERPVLSPPSNQTESLPTSLPVRHAIATGDWLSFPIREEKTLQWFESAHEGSNKNEALVRVRLNQVLGLTLGFAKDVRIIKDHPKERALSWGYETHFRILISVPFVATKQNMQACPY